MDLHERSRIALWVRLVGLPQERQSKAHFEATAVAKRLATALSAVIAGLPVDEL